MNGKLGVFLLGSTRTKGGKRGGSGGQLQIMTRRSLIGQHFKTKVPKLNLSFPRVLG